MYAHDLLWVRKRTDSVESESLVALRRKLTRIECARALIVSIAFLCGVLFHSIHDYTQVLNNNDVLSIGVTGGSLMLRKTAITRIDIPSFFKKVEV